MATSGNIRGFINRPRGAPSGVRNVDSPGSPERVLRLPWIQDPEVSWVDHRCWIEVYLDAGMALHKPLPQGPPSSSAIPPADTLASGTINDPNLISNTNGVNLKSQGGYADVVQKMATSTYRFVLKGWALRAGHKVPIPGLKTVGGVPAIPGEIQFATNILVGVYSGVSLYLGQWELWYYVTLPPTTAQVPPTNLAAHQRGDAQLPDTLGVPFSQPDSNYSPTVRVLRTGKL